jgi:hypothetical protein
MNVRIYLIFNINNSIIFFESLINFCQKRPSFVPVELFAAAIEMENLFILIIIFLQVSESYQELQFIGIIGAVSMD